MSAAGEVAVEAVGDAREDEDDAGDNRLLAAAEARCAMALKWKDRREYPDEQRNAGNSAHRDGVGQVHGPVMTASMDSGSRLADTSILPH